MCEAVRRLTSNESEWQAARPALSRFIDRHYSEDVVLQPYLEASVAIKKAGGVATADLSKGSSQTH